jgi:hypothetical protein
MLATRGIFNQNPPNGPPQTVTTVGEDTDNEESAIADGEETSDVDRKVEQPPARTYLWLNEGNLSICPPLPDPLSGAALRYMA